MKGQSLFDFPIKREPIYNSMSQDTGFDSIFRAQEGTPLGVVSRDYKLVEHKKAIDLVLKAFDKQKIAIEPVNIEMSNQGARMFASFRTLKEVDLGISVKSNKQVGDIVSIGFKVLNSYDRSLRFSLPAEVLRLACTNGMTVREGLFSKSRRHTVGLDVERMVEEFIVTFEAFEAEIVPALSKLTQEIVTPDLLQKELNTVPGWVQDYSLEYLEKAEFIAIEEDEEDGSPVIEVKKDISKWDLLNTFTYILSHDDKSSPERRLEETKKVSDRYLLLTA